jgi:hypothetical protein
MLDNDNTHMKNNLVFTANHRISPAKWLLIWCLLCTMGAELSLSASTVAYYRFEEGTNGYTPSGVGTILDSSGNGLNGTPFGGLIYSSNVPINPIPLTGATNLLSLNFDGFSGRVFIPDYPQLELTNSLTLEAFINAAAGGAGPYDVSQIIFRGDDRGFWDPYQIYLDGTNLTFSVTDTNNTMSSVEAPISLNIWHHVAGTLDDATGLQSLYIDGALVAQTNTTKRPFGPLIGANPGLGIGDLQSTIEAEYFNGLIDEVRISDVALSPSQFLDAPQSANVSLGFCPALTITGIAGYSYTIQGSTNVGNSNGWITLTNLTLTEPVELWIDTTVNASSPFNSQHFYRVTPQ